MRSPTVQTKLDRIAEQARRYPDRVFTTLYYQIDEAMLRDAFKEVKKDRSAGVDGRTKREYSRDLDANLKRLVTQLVERTYRPHPVKRVWLDKEDNKKRPIGIPALEDKIVGRAVTMILESIYENDFYDFSYGFRPGRSAHMAIKSIWKQCTNKNIRWIVDCDVTAFFDSIDHTKLREILRRRMNDGRIRWLIDLWLKAGVWENGHVRGTKRGTPQGSVVSPILANIFLHVVLDEWYAQEIEPLMHGRTFIVRWADDFVIGCEDERDALRLMMVLPKRFQSFGLEIHPEKSRLVAFQPPKKGKKDVKKDRTFDFLGFTHYWGKSQKGNWIIKRRTKKSRLARATHSIWTWCRDHRHWNLPEQWEIIKAKLRGHYNYYGVINNYESLEVLYHWAKKAWKRWLGRRTRSGALSWDDFEQRILSVFPFPRPYIVEKS